MMRGSVIENDNGDDDEVFFDATVDESHRDESAMPRRMTAQKMVERDRLELCGRWLASIPTDDIPSLRQTREYTDFLKAFERLGQAHRRVVALGRSSMETDDPDDRSHMAPFSFLQHLVKDDVLMRVFEYLGSHSLVQTSRVCARFRELADISATQRTQDIAPIRQLGHAMQLLRAKEQIDGVGDFRRRISHVSVPLLAMRQRILVTGAGDADFNGVYYCTGTNGNGFVYTKPRTSMLRASMPSLLSHAPVPLDEADGVDIDTKIQQGSALSVSDMKREQHRVLNWDSENAVKPGDLLRCIISKRFSDETILWYMSKEVETETNDPNTGAVVPQVKHVFSYWAKLMHGGEAPVEVCCLPSFTEVLTRNGNPGWQSLSSTRLTDPPFVSLMDD